MAYEAILCEVGGAAAAFALNRPERLNAIDRRILSGPETACAAAEADDD